MSSESSNGLGDTGTVVLEDKPDLKEPPMYQVVLLNDDFPHMEFVVYILQNYSSLSLLILIFFLNQYKPKHKNINTIQRAEV